MTTIKEDWDNMPGGWKIITIIGVILIIKAIFALGASFSFSI